MAKLDTTYSPERVKVTVDGITLQKLGEAGVTLTWAEDRAALVIGSGGDSIRTINPSRSGTLEVSLQFDGPQVSLLNGLVQNGSTFDVLLTDLNTGSTWTLANAFISTEPTVEFSKDAPGDRSYTIMTPRLTANPVGALPGITV